MSSITIGSAAAYFLLSYIPVVFKAPYVFQAAKAAGKTELEVVMAPRAAFAEAVSGKETSVLTFTVRRLVMITFWRECHGFMVRCCLPCSLACLKRTRMQWPC